MTQNKALSTVCSVLSVVMRLNGFSDRPRQSHHYLATRFIGKNYSQDLCAVLELTEKLRLDENDLKSRLKLLGVFWAISRAFKETTLS